MFTQKTQARGAGSISRRDFVKGVGVAGVAGLAWAAGGGLLTGCAPAPAAGPESLSVQLSWLKNVEFISFYAADIKGYYKEENLTVDLAGGGPGVNAGQLVDSRQKDIGVQLAALDLVSSVAQGSKLVTFGTLFQRSPAGLMYIIKRPDGTPGTIIDTPEKAKGKRIGLQTGAMLAWRVITQKAGLDMDNDMTIVNVSYDPSPLADGTVDGYWCFATSQPQILEAQGYEVGVLDAYQAGYTTAGGFLTCHQDFLSTKKDVLVRFLRASIKGCAYAYSHIEEMAKYVVDTFGQELKLVYEEQLSEGQAEADYVRSALTDEKGLFYIDTKQWEDTVSMMVAQKQLDKPIDIKTFVNTDIVTEVYKAGKASLGQ